MRSVDRGKAERAAPRPCPHRPSCRLARRGSSLARGPGRVSAGAFGSPPGRPTTGESCASGSRGPTAKPAAQAGLQHRNRQPIARPAGAAALLVVPWHDVARVLEKAVPEHDVDRRGKVERCALVCVGERNLDEAMAVIADAFGTPPSSGPNTKSTGSGWAKSRRSSAPAVISTHTGTPSGTNLTSALSSQRSSRDSYPLDRRSVRATIVENGQSLLVAWRAAATVEVGETRTPRLTTATSPAARVPVAAPPAAAPARQHTVM
jgi:hypothetical protein